MSNPLFFLVFFSLFFLLILTGGTFWGWLVMAVLAGMLVWASRSFPIKRTPHPVLQALILIAVIIEGIGVFGAMSMPLALGVFFTHVFAYIVFLFFFSVDESELPTEMIQQGLVLIGVALAAFVLILTFAPTLGSVIPAKSLLATSYGHNHASIFLLMVFPSAWQLYLKKSKKIWRWALLVLFTLGVLFSFSRLNIFLFFILLVYLLFRSWKYGNVVSKKMIALVLSVGVFFSMILFMTLAPSYLSGSFCSSEAGQAHTKLCKPIGGEPRLYYWGQALEAIQEKPVWGWGGDAFALLSKMYRQEVEYFATYPHNAYLEVFVELGIVGAMPLILLMVLVGHAAVRSSTETVQNDFSSSQALGLGVLVFFVDGVTDYNWSIGSIWVLFWICAALLLRQFPQWAEKTSKKKHQQRGNMLWYALVGLFAVWSLFVVASGWCRVAGNLRCAVRFFPFDEQIVLDAQGGKQLTADQTELLDMLYQNHSRYLELRLQEQRDEDDKLLYYSRILELDPLQVGTWMAKIELLIAEKRWNTARAEIDAFTQVFPRERYLSSVFDPPRTTFVETLIATANRLWYDNPEHAQHFYLTAAKLLPWQFSDVTISAFEQPKEEDAQYLHALLDELEPKWLWKYQDTLATWYKKEAVRALRAQEWDRVQAYTQKALQLNPTLRWQIWDELSPEINHMITEYAKAQERHKQSAALQAWQNIYQLAQPNDGEESLRPSFKNWLDARLDEYQQGL